MSTPTRSLKSERAHAAQAVKAQPDANSHTNSYGTEAHEAARTPRYVGDGRGPALTLLPPGGGEKPRETSQPDTAGRPLPSPTREAMESRFGADFGDVRVHTEPGAADEATALGASAYTLGRDIVFAEGEYEPGTEAGDRLIAHELTHVLQQSPDEEATRPQAAPASGEVGESGSHPEAEAERNAEAVARGERVRVRPVPGGVEGPQLYPARIGVHELAVHRDPDASSPVVLRLRRGDRFDAGEVLGGWQQVTVTRGRRTQQGYVPTTEGLPNVFDPIQPQQPNPYLRPLRRGFPSLPGAGSRPTPYLARIVNTYARIFPAPPTRTQPGQTATVVPAPIRDFGDNANIFVTVTDDPSVERLNLVSEWVRVRHGATDGWMRRADIVPVTGDTQRDLQESALRHVTGSESHDRPGHYSTSSRRDNIGIGSWTCGRIAVLMRRYRTVFGRHRRESELYAFFGGRARFDEIQGRFRQHANDCSRHGGFLLTPREVQMFESAGRHPLIRAAEDEQMDTDFASYMIAPAELRAIYPWVGDDDTISEMMLTMLVSMRHRGELPDTWRGDFRRVRAEYEAHPDQFPGGEADFLRAVARRLASHVPPEERVGILNRYMNVVTAFRESRRRFTLPRAGDGERDDDAQPNDATPNSRRRARPRRPAGPNV